MAAPVPTAMTSTVMPVSFSNGGFRMGRSPLSWVLVVVASLSRTVWAASGASAAHTSSAMAQILFMRYLQNESF